MNRSIDVEVKRTVSVNAEFSSSQLRISDNGWVTLQNNSLDEVLELSPDDFLNFIGWLQDARLRFMHEKVQAELNDETNRALKAHEPGTMKVHKPFDVETVEEGGWPFNCNRE